ncbi:MAG: hypothetical protein RIT81_10550 [Deltaproteobacteria bacterium]
MSDGSLQKPALFNGLSRQYQKKDEDSEDYPPENVRVQMNAASLLDEISENMVEYFDVVAQKDWANCEAKANVEVDGKVLLENVPATYLLFLEKYEATEHHPAQTELVSLDEVVGTWHTVLHSGAIPAPRKKVLQKRLQNLIKAVKFAREAANESKAPKKEVGQRVFGYLFE